MSSKLRHAEICFPDASVNPLGTVHPLSQPSHRTEAGSLSIHHCLVQARLIHNDRKDVYPCWKPPGTPSLAACSVIKYLVTPASIISDKIFLDTKTRGLLIFFFHEVTHLVGGPV